VRTLRKKIDSMLYERTAISKKPEQAIQTELSLLQNEQLTPDIVFHDPYILDFLGLHDAYTEKDLENAIITELQQFICEMGADFAFLSRQKRITIDNEDYYIDLLFFHRRLRCLVAIDLKLGAFKAAYKGQMELYLNWLRKNEMLEGENHPIGLILCADKNEEHIELMHLKESNIRVAEYITKLPERTVLEDRLQRAIEKAKHRLANSKDTIET
jgi:predicted nuclease of restriction endonuclease-like (RecB) superfamily